MARARRNGSVHALVAVLFFAGGCSLSNDEIRKKTDPAPPSFRQSEFIFHRVMAGETMASIARWYSGKENQWRTIADHNPSMNPRQLQKGDIVKVPLTMATVHAEQPKASTAPRPKSRKSKAPYDAGRAPQDAEEGAAHEAVFGPK